MNTIEICVIICGVFTCINIIIHIFIKCSFYNDVLRFHNEQKQWYCDLLETLKDLHNEGYKVIKQ